MTTSPSIPILSGNRIMLRPYLSSDRPLFVALVQDREITRFTGGVMSDKEAEALFTRIIETDDPDMLSGWAVILQASRRMIGHTALLRRDRYQGHELIVMLDKKFWGSGLGAEAGNLLLAHAFGARNCDRLVATIDPEHEASIGLAAALGFELEQYDQDEEGHFPVYVLSADAWRTRRKK